MEKQYLTDDYGRLVVVLVDDSGFIHPVPEHDDEEDDYVDQD